MGMDEATARGIQSLVWLSAEDSPARQHAVETMIDLTDQQAQAEQQQEIDSVRVPSGVQADIGTGLSKENAPQETQPDFLKEALPAPSEIITDGSHIENGILKPNVTYQTGEHDYFYQTNGDGLIVRAIAKVLQFKNHDGRLHHNPNTLGKRLGDHAGHLFGDRFGGSPELDNLVSQARMVNLSEYKTLENQWANALKNDLEVSVQIDIKYEPGNSRPVAFDVKYSIAGEIYYKTINN